MSESVFGETLYEGIGTGNGPAVYTPWMSRMGDKAVFAIEIIEISGVTVSWNIETKNSEDPDEDATALLASDETDTAVGVHYPGDVPAPSGTAGIKELVRYRIKTGDSPSLDWVQLRVLAPSWQRNQLG